MTDSTCHWPDCDRAKHGRNLCKTHNQSARRQGIIDQFWSPANCATCGELMTGARTSKVYCSKRCFNVALWQAADKKDRAQKHKAWRDRVEPARKAKALASKPTRYCEECGADLPREANARRRFCNRYCINQKRLRDKPYQARELHRRRHQRLVGPGVSEKDWAKLVRRFAGCCAYCGRADARLTQDHVVPVSRGGQHAIGNLLPACWSCNNAKRFRLLVEWRLGRSASYKNLTPTGRTAPTRRAA